MEATGRSDRERGARRRAGSAGGLALLVLALTIASCGSDADPGGETTATAEPPAPPAAEGAGPEALGTPPSGPAGVAPEAAEPVAVPAGTAEVPPSSTACERARACCAAYVAALPSPRRTVEARVCDEMDRVLGETHEATDEACEAAIGGWRQTLQLTGIEIPAACLD